MAEPDRLPHPDQVDFVSGRTRLFGIVGHPIEQVRSPEMITAEMRGRGHDALLVPLHVLPEDFETTVRGLMRMPNLGGLVFTIPYKARALALADRVGPQAAAVGAANVMVRGRDSAWVAEIFDGQGLVEAFRRRGLGFRGKRVCLIGLGGAGSAIAVAVAHEGPERMRLYDPDGARAEAVAAAVRLASPITEVVLAPPSAEGVDALLNASPVGMLGDARLPLDAAAIPATTVVFDAIVKPERTPLLRLAEACGCVTVQGREMMRGQIARMVDFFDLAHEPNVPPATGKA